MIKQYKKSILLAAFVSVFLVDTLIAQTVIDSAIIITKGSFSGIKNIAFGTQPAQQVTGAISTVTGASLEKNFNLNLGNTLFGRLPGVTTTQGGSEPGQGVPNLYVRGINTFGGASNSPLYIIDGFISNGVGSSNTFMQLIPEEIETISVLKDASATALYGARGANGVILVTTKTGKEGALKVGFSSRQGFNQAQSLPKFLDAQNYSILFNEALVNDGQAPRFTQADLDAYRDGTDPVFRPNVNWYDQVLKSTSPVSSYNLNFSGGDKTVRYFGVLNAITSQSLLKKFGDIADESTNSNYTKYNFRTNVDINITKRLAVEFKVAGAIEQTNNPNAYNTGGTFNLLQSLAPNSFPVINPNGTFGGNAQYSNPYANLLATGFFQNNTRTVLSSLKLIQQLDMITPGLNASVAISSNNYFEQGSIKSKNYARFSLTKGPLGDTIYSNPIGQLTTLAGSEQTVDQYRNLIFQGALNYKRTFGKSEVTGLIMFNNDQVTLFGPSSNPSNPTANSTDPYKHNSSAARFTYAYDNKYLAEFSLGYMGSEIFAPGNRYGFFPAGSIGWIASNENFLKKSKQINFLKFRASYGQTGNDIIAPQGLPTRYAFTPTFGGAGYNFGTANNSFAGFGENAIANNNITWEKEQHLNIGLDATFFKNFDISFDYFNRNRKDILVASNRTTPLFLGVNTPNLNLGKSSTQGFDLSLRYSNNNKKDLQFYIEANVSYSKSTIVYNAEVLQLNPGLLNTGLSVGQPIGLVAIGFYTPADIAQRLVDLKSVPGVLTEVIKAGDIKYLDFGGPNGTPDGIIDGNDRRAIGNPSIPRLIGGLNAGLTFKGFDLNLIFNASFGNTSYLGGTVFHAFQNNGQVGPIALGRWTPATAATADYPRLSAINNQNNYQFSSFWQRDGSFVKLRSAELGYTFPAKVTNRLKLNSTRFFLNGTNLFSIDNIEFGDPESLGGYPVMRTITVGFKIQF